MAMSDQQRDYLISQGAPAWEGQTIELFIEVAATCEPADRYASKLFELTGRARQDRYVRQLLRTGIMQDMDPAKREIYQQTSPGDKRTLPLAFTPMGIEYCVDAMDRRIDQMEKARDGLLAIHFTIEPITEA